MPVQGIVLFGVAPPVSLGIALGPAGGVVLSLGARAAGFFAIWAEFFCALASVRVCASLGVTDGPAGGVVRLLGASEAEFIAGAVCAWAGAALQASAAARAAAAGRVWIAYFFIIVPSVVSKKIGAFFSC